MTAGARRVAVAWSAVALAPASILPLALIHEEDVLVPWAWGASGLLLGASLLLDRRQRLLAVLAGSLVTSAALAASGSTAGFACVLGLVLLAEVQVARRYLLGAGSEFVLNHRADIFRLISATTAAAGLGALMVGAYLLAFEGVALSSTRLFVGSVFMTHAASILALLPFFVHSRTPVDAMPAATFTFWAAVLVLATLAVFVLPQLPPVFFALLPMFAWLAFRANLRAVAAVLVVVGLITMYLTVQGIGPVVQIAQNFDLPRAVVPSILNLFLLDCALVMYPVAVIVGEHADAAKAAHVDRARLSGVLNGASSVGIIAADCEGTIVVFSQGAARMTGHEASQMLGRDLATLGMDLLSYAQDGPETAAEGTPPRRLWELVRSDGEQRTLAVTVMETHDRDERRDGQVLTLEDLTDQRAAHEATKTALGREKELVAHLEELDHVKDAFVATVSHELRTPVTSIAGYLELLTDGDAGELTPQQRELLIRVTRNSRRLQVLVEDLLLVSRIESRSLVLQLERVDVREAAREVAARYTNAVPGAGSEIVLEAEDPAWMRADPAQIERMIAVFVDNAMKFSPDAGAVHIRVSSKDEFVEVSVADSGLGIPLAEQTKLFTPFFRSTVSVELATQGAGMGLTIAHAVCQAHGGSIEIVSTPGCGTMVSALLPVAGPNATSSDLGPPKVPTPRGTPRQPA